MNIDRTIQTADQAIEESIAHNCIAHVCLPMEEADKLGLEADDCIEISGMPDFTDYWGMSEDGKTWRVYDYSE